MALVFFKTNKHKRFNYKPLYYDERKEELEELKKKSSSEKEVKLEEMRGKIRTRWQHSRKIKTNRFAGIRVLFILGILIFLAYILLR